MIGELAQHWKRNILAHSKTGGVLINFVQNLTMRTLYMYEAHSNPTQLAEIPKYSGKDYVGFNLLLAITLCNVTRSHEEALRKKSEEKLEDEEFFSSGNMTTNTYLQDEIKTIVSLTQSNFNAEHKTPFGKFYPSRFWTSNVLISFLYYLQEPVDHKSLENLKEIFIYEADKVKTNQNFYENCLLFYTLIVLNGN